MYRNGVEVLRKNEEEFPALVNQINSVGCDAVGLVYRELNGDLISYVKEEENE